MPLTKKELSKANPVSLKDYLEGYAQLFSMDVDELWHRCDVDNNNILDRAEAKVFMQDLQKIMTSERAKNYSDDKFEQLFEKFDSDKNNYLDKSEMSILIKQTFANKKKSNSKVDLS